MARTHIRARFGKEIGLAGADLQAFVAVGHRESSTLEAKGLARVPSLEAKREELLVSPLIQMLNKEDQTGGLLVLGVSAANQLANQLSPSTEAGLTEPKLRGWLLDLVKAVPAANVPDLELVPVAVDGGTAFLIEAHPSKFPATYYSALTNQVYVRAMDTKVTLSLPEALATIERRSHARVFLRAGRAVAERSGDDYLFDLSWINEGTKPAKNVMAILEVSLPRGAADVRLVSENSATLRNARPQTVGTFQVQTATNMHLPLYPGQGAALGALSFRLAQGHREFEALVQATIYEQSGRTQQTLRLRMDGTGSGFDPGELSKSFASYNR